MDLSFYHKQISDVSSNEDKKAIVLSISEKLRESHEWDLSGVLLDDFSTKFFFDIDISYKAMLGLLDSARYEVALYHLNFLIENINLISDPFRLVGIFRAASNLGQHNTAHNIFIYVKSLGIQSINLSAVAFRLEKALMFSNTNFPTIISIGENCLPWMLPNRWGLRNQHSIINDNLLFNLGQTSTEMVSLIIEERAKQFLSTANFELCRSGNSVFPKNMHYHYDFNHEQGDFWLSNDFSQLLHKYQLKINNFFNHLSSPDPKIYLHYVEFPGDLNRIVNSFLTMPNSNNSILLIVDVRLDCFPLFDCHSNVVYLSIRKPSALYQWFKPDDIDSSGGVYFEYMIVSAIVSCARNITNQSLN